MNAGASLKTEMKSITKIATATNVGEIIKTKKRSIVKTIKATNGGVMKAPKKTSNRLCSVENKSNKIIKIK